MIYRAIALSLAIIVGLGTILPFDRSARGSQFAK